MIRIYLPNQDLPHWLARQYPIEGEEWRYKQGRILFASLSIVIKWKGSFHVAPIYLRKRKCVIRAIGADYINLKFMGKNNAMIHWSLYSLVKHILKTKRKNHV